MYFGVLTVSAHAGEIGKQLGEQWRNLTPEEKRASDFEVTDYA